MTFVLGIIIGAAAVLIAIGCHRLIAYDRYNEGYVKGIEIGKKIQLLEIQCQGKGTEEEAQV